MLYLLKHNKPLSLEVVLEKANYFATKKQPFEFLNNQTSIIFQKYLK
jgi:hypothetical protein